MHEHKYQYFYHTFLGSYIDIDQEQTVTLRNCLAYLLFFSHLNPLFAIIFKSIFNMTF